MTEEDVKRIFKDMQTEKTGPFDLSQWQWLVRAAYYAGWVDSGGDDTASPHNEPPRGWRAGWIASTPRDILLRNGVIRGDEGYK